MTNTFSLLKSFCLNRLETRIDELQTERKHREAAANTEREKRSQELKEMDSSLESLKKENEKLQKEAEKLGALSKKLKVCSFSACYFINYIHFLV